MSEETNNTGTVEQPASKSTDTESKSERTFNRDELAKIVSSEREKWEKQHAEDLEHAKSEGERLAKLSKDQREKEESDRRLAELEQREQEIAMRELRIETQTLLMDEGLPSEFLDIVLASTADEVKENISNLRQTFDAEVEKRVNERLVQKTPRTGNSSSGLTKAQIMAEKDDAKRHALIAENRDLFK